VRIDTNGLGIGTGTGAITRLLDVAGDARFRNCSGSPVMDANGNMFCISDEKAKTNIQPYNTATSKVASVNPKSWTWKSSTGLDTTRPYYGFSAQEIQAIYPECVIARDDVTYVEDVVKGKDGEKPNSTTREVKTGTQTLNIDDRCLIAVLFNAVKEQQTTLASQEKRIAALEEKAGMVKV
jgi:hypothetical protein